jgi:uncharacterized repeat protein (TIGR03803 family)
MNMKALASLCVMAVVASLAPVMHAQTFGVIHTFTGGADGASPYAGVLVGRDGNLYGTTVGGGGGSCDDYQFPPGCGTVYQLNPSNQSFTTLWQFSGNPDGAYPEAGLVVGPGGAMYGSTGFGGSQCNSDGCGTVYRLTPPATPPRTIKQAQWKVTTLHSFDYYDGWEPTGNLAVDGSGNLYGATRQGASGGDGGVFRLSNLNGVWTFSGLHDFDGYDNFPEGGVILDTAENIYGTTAGSVYQLIAGSGWRLNVLYTFSGNDNNGDGAFSGVTLDSAGNVYGSTAQGGVGNGGTVFELSSGSWLFNLLHTFGGGGGGPVFSNLIFDTAGNLYGTTNGDGKGYGSVFKLMPSNNAWTYTSLHDFTGGSDGGFPIGTLAFDDAGNLYGTTSSGGDLSKCKGYGCGVVFKITP